MASQSLSQRNCILSADGKPFSVPALLSMVSSMATSYVRYKGYSMQMEDIQEVVSEVSLIISQKFSTRYNTSKGSVDAWLFRIVCNEVNTVMHQIISRMNKLSALQDYYGNERLSEDADAWLIASETKKEFDNYLSSVSVFKSSCMSLRYEGYESGEIADELGVDDNKIYRTVHRERKVLKARFDR